MKNFKMKKILFTGGGTWWHIFPIKALIEKIPSEYEILWVGEKWKLENKIANQLKENWYNVKFLPIMAWKLRRQLDIKSIFLNFIDVFKNIFGFFQSVFYILKYKPEFVFCKWGFVAFWPSIVGKILWKKVYLHESDTVPWLVNKIVWKFADKIFVWFDEVKWFNKNKTLVVWQILTDQLLKFNENWQHWKTNLLVIWWSQWAKPLILAVKNLLDKWFLLNFNIFVVWGLLNKENVFKDYKNVKFYEFLDQIELFKLYQLADISITRWSATSLAEQDYFNIKKIVVPLPFTWWNHQYFNWIAYLKKWDFLLSQQDKDFEEKLLQILKKMENYKKKFVLNKEVLEWKERILKEIL